MTPVLERKYVRSFDNRMRAESFADGLVYAGWPASIVEVVEEDASSGWRKQYVVYKLEPPTPKPPVTPRKRTP